MEIINPNGTKEDIDITTLNDDLMAKQLKKHEEIVSYFKENDMYIWAFTLDSLNRGGCFYNLPDDGNQKIEFMVNMKQKIETLTNNTFTLAPNTL